jgi:hypothetical protein
MKLDVIDCLVEQLSQMNVSPEVERIVNKLVLEATTRAAASDAYRDLRDMWVGYYDDAVSALDAITDGKSPCNYCIVACEDGFCHSCGRFRYNPDWRAQDD